MERKISKEYSDTSHYTGEPRYNKPLFNEYPGMTNDILQPGNSKMDGEKKPDITSPSCNEHILPFPWHFRLYWGSAVSGLLHFCTQCSVAG